MHKRVYEFSEGSIEDRQLLGIKGSYLCEMSKRNLPVPDGFILTSEACQDFFSSRNNTFLSPHLLHNLRQAVTKLEKKTGKYFKSEPTPMSSAQSAQSAQSAGLTIMEPPLLLSVRSSTAAKLPGMTDTILNLGINDKSCALLAKQFNLKFALEVHWRFLMMFGTIVMKVPHAKFEEILTEQRAACGVAENSQLDVDSLNAIILNFKELAEVPVEPFDQLRIAVEAIFCSWYNESAVKYREMNHFDEDAGTAIVIQEMVFGNLNSQSCTGVAFSRNPETGDRAMDGEFCFGEGEDVNAGLHEPQHINELKLWGANTSEERERGGPVYQEVQRLVTALEKMFGDVQQVEFTVENGHVYVLQSESAMRSPKANVKFAVQLVNEGLITERDALLRVNALQMDYFLKPTVNPSMDVEAMTEKLLGHGLAVCSGAVTGEAVFTEDAAQQCFHDGRPCILIRNDASAADLQGIAAADGVVCMEGGSSSYLVEVCRPLNRTCIVGAQLCGMTLGTQQTEAKSKSNMAVYDNVGRVAIEEGQVITLDGSSGRILNGPVLTVEEGVNNAFRTILRWADQYKKLSVFADITEPQDIHRNLDFGSDGVGMLRMESLLIAGKKRDVVLDYIIVYGRDIQSQQTRGNSDADACAPPLSKSNIHSLAIPHTTDILEDNSQIHPDRRILLEALEHALLPDLKGVFESNSGKSVAVTFLNTSLNSFLPPEDALGVPHSSEQKADSLLQELARRTNTTPQDCFSIIESLRDQNPLLGVKGCRYAIVNPEFLTMQVRAILGAGLQVIREGNARMGLVQFMIPMVSSEHETLAMVTTIKAACEDFFTKHVRLCMYTLSCSISYFCFSIERMVNALITQLALLFKHQGFEEVVLANGLVVCSFVINCVHPQGMCAHGSHSQNPSNLIGRCVSFVAILCAWWYSKFCDLC